MTLLVNAGGVRVVAPKEIKNVVLIGWVLGNTWLSYAESAGKKMDRSALNEAIEMMMVHYQRYLLK